ncbi:hypothetical protein [Clostridium sp. UBA1056]|uniref:hypothetical protein n=1 Tax=unclassified Clostridium TaxID=2614128 RepID=UPI0032171444
MTITFDSRILDNENLKPVHINLFLNLIKVSEFGEVKISVTEIMKLIKCNNRKYVIDYLRVLEGNDLLTKNSVNGVTNIYTLNQNYYAK